MAPRPGWETRLCGGMIQASNSANFSNGVVTLYTITNVPPSGTLTTVKLSNTTEYRYYRYIGPTNSYCDIEELEFLE
jgi:endoglucanase